MNPWRRWLSTSRTSRSETHLEFTLSESSLVPMEHYGLLPASTLHHGDTRGFLDAFARSAALLHTNLRGRPSFLCDQSSEGFGPDDVGPRGHARLFAKRRDRRTRFTESFRDLKSTDDSRRCAGAVSSQPSIVANEFANGRPTGQHGKSSGRETEGRTRARSRSRPPERRKSWIRPSRSLP